MNIPEISLFNGSAQEVIPTDIITVSQFLINIKKGAWKSHAERIREIADHNERQDLKRQILPSVTVSGTFSRREDKALIKYSGFLAIDIDYLDESDYPNVWKSIISDQHTYAAFKSVGGQGICVIIPTTDPSSHKDHFRWAEKHYLNLADISIDKSCKNISRIRYVSYDPDCYIFPSAKPAGKIKETKTKINPLYTMPATDSQIGRIVSEIGANGIDITEPYDRWFNIALALVSEFGESGRQYYHIISGVSHKYNPGKTDQKYDSAIRKSNGEVTIGTLFHYVKEVGIETHTHEERKAFAISKVAFKSKSDIESAVSAAEQSGINPKLTKEIAQKVFDNDIEIESNSNSIILDIAAFVKMNYKIERNIITKRIERDGIPVDDNFYNDVYNAACVAISDKVNRADITSVIESSMTPEYCPIDRWIKEHDHLPHQPEIIDQLLNTIPYKHPEAREFIKHWLLGIPATYYGDVVRLVLVLCGKQMTGKSYWIRNLFKRDGKEKFFDEYDLMDQYETVMLMSSKLVILDDEFGGKSRKDAIKFKELTSKASFSMRMKYGRNMTEFRRLAMLCGTTNETEILNDSTGNTRILPVEFNEKYDYELYNSIDKTQLLVEIFRAYHRGESWQLSETAQKTLEKLNGQHQVANIEQELIDLYLEPDTSPYADILSTTEIKAGIEKMSGQRISVRKLGEELKKITPWREVRKNYIKKRGYQMKWRQSNNQNPF